MSTISVPLPTHLEEFIKETAEKRGSNKAEVVRAAITFFAEEEAVQAVLRAEREPTLRGDLKELAKKI